MEGCGHCQGIPRRANTDTGSGWRSASGRGGCRRDVASVSRRGEGVVEGAGSDGHERKERGCRDDRRRRNHSGDQRRHAGTASRRLGLLSLPSTTDNRPLCSSRRTRLYRRRSSPDCPAFSTLFPRRNAYDCFRIRLFQGQRNATISNTSDVRAAPSSRSRRVRPACLPLCRLSRRSCPPSSAFSSRLRPATLIS